MAKKEQPSKGNLWKERYSIAVNNQTPMFDKWAKWFELMYATVNDKNIALWRSKIFIPILAGKAWNLIAKFVGLKPGFEVTVRDPERAPEELKAAAEQMQKKLEYDYSNPRLDESIRDKIMSPLIDAVVTGTGIAKVPWEVKTVKRYERLVGDDGTIDLTREKVIESKQGHNDLIPVNIFNVFVAPTSSNLYSAPWIIIKEYKTLDQLKSKGIYKNLDKLENARSGSDQFAQYKKSRNRLTNSQDPISDDNTLDLIPIYECYEGDMICTYADAGSKGENDQPWVELRSQKNTYWHGKYPLVRFAVKQRPYEFFGEGIFELTERLQSAVNDVFNHYMDNWNLSVDGLWMIEENSNVDDFVIQPGGQVIYRGTAPQPTKFPEPNPNSVSNVLQVLEKAIEDSTISSYASGSPNSATDTTAGTATGIMRLQQAAGDIISFMRANFQQTIHQLGIMWLSNNQQYLDRVLTIQDGKEEVRIDPAELQGDMELQIDDASMEPVSKEDQRAMYSQFVQETLALQAASVQQSQSQGTKPLVLEFDELFEQLADKYGIKTSESLIMDEEQQAIEQQETMQEQMAMQPPMQPGMEQMPPEMPQDPGMEDPMAGIENELDQPLNPLLAKQLGMDQ